MYAFPARTWQSDLNAKRVAEALERAHAGENFMVSVGTTRSGKVYVAVSGGARGPLLAALRRELTFGATLQSPAFRGMGKKPVDRIKRNALTGAERQAARMELTARKLAPRAGGVFVVLTNLSRMNRSLMDDNRAATQHRAAHRASAFDNPLSYPNERNCAEPKLIEGATDAGETITGMTTIWYGSQANPYRDPRAAAGISPARPCGICARNERLIMVHAQR
jgi:hypothetical protein